MHARHQAESAAWIALNAPAVLRSSGRLEGLLAASYWSNAKARQVRWNAALKMFDEDIRNPDRSHNPWPAIETVLDEIIVSEMLTRVWSAVLVSVDEASGQGEMAGLAHSVFIGHMEARNRALRLLIGGRHLNERLFDRANQLRRNIEKWTDLFLAAIPNPQVARRFAFDRARFDDFRGEQGLYPEQELSTRQQVLIRSMASMLESLTGQWIANPELNRRIVDGILACLDREMFAPEGMPKFLQALWMERSHSDAALLLGQLESLEQGSLPGRR